MESESNNSQTNLQHIVIIIHKNNNSKSLMRKIKNISKKIKSIFDYANTINKN